MDWGALGAGAGAAALGPLGGLAGWGMSKLFGKEKDPNASKDPTSYTAAHGGQAPGPGELAPESIDRKQDSLTQATRGLTNYMGQAGKESYERGIKQSERGRDITDSGLHNLGPTLDYFGKLLSGDPAQIAEAMQPEVDQISQQFGQIRNMFSRTQARGGGGTSTMAQSPFEQIRMLSDLVSKARGGAAESRGKFGLEQARIGQGETQIGQGEESMGVNTLSATNQGLLARRGQNYQVDTANKQMPAQLIEALL
jgi:hypothetical protein